MARQTKVEKTDGWKRALPFLLIVGASALAHLWCVRSVFFLDDILLRDSPVLREGRWWNSNFLQWSYFCFWIQMKIWGTSPVGFHFVNWLLHTGCALALYLFGRDGLKIKGNGGVALCGALLFVVHPLGSEIPNYARAQDLAWVTLFSLLAAWLMVRLMVQFHWGLLGGVLLCVAGATFSKGPGLFHAVMMVAFAVLGCATKEHWNSLRKRWWVWLSVGLLVFLSLWLSGLLETWYQKGAPRWKLEAFRWHTVTLCRVFWKFVHLFFVPKGLCADHFIDGTMSWEDEEAVPAIVGVVLWVCLATGLMVWRKTRFVGMCLWLFVGAILLRMLYFINEFMPEYRIYPGLPWLCLGLMVVAWAGWRKWTQVPPGGLVGCLVLILCLVSAARSFQWHSLDTLCEDILRKYPGQGRALWMLQRRDAEAEDWEAIIARHPRFRGEVVKAFVSENKRTGPGRLMSAGHFIMAQTACYAYYAEALTAVGRWQEGMAVIRGVWSDLQRRGIPAEEMAIWNTYYHGLGRVHEQRGEWEEALQALAKIKVRDYREVDRDRIRAKWAMEKEKRE